MKADNAHRMLGINQSGLAKNVEKLSSGLRVNRAADDAAGLYISEKMRSQVRGLNQASRNALDGISAVQTAEGALDEVHSMLQRMRELSVQAANDPNQKEDRDAIQAEMDQLYKEIDSVSEKTEFNKQKLLNGDFSGKKLQVGANQNQYLDITIDSMSAEGIGLGGEAPDATQKAMIEAEIKGLETELGKDDGSDDGTLNKQLKDEKDKIKKDDGSGLLKTYNDAKKAHLDEVKKADATAADIKTKEEAMNNAKDALEKQQKIVDSIQEKVDAKKMRVAQLTKLKDKTTGDKVSVGSYDEANESIGKIDKAIAAVSKQRSKLGAIQNRLEHTIKNLDNAAENTQAAESRIRDIDMAKEMSTFTRNNILTQASQAMLAQANQLPQQVLQLLR